MVLSGTITPPTVSIQRDKRKTSRGKFQRSGWKCQHSGTVRDGFVRVDALVGLSAVEENVDECDNARNLDASAGEIDLGLSTSAMRRTFPTDSRVERKRSTWRNAHE